jgi:hypothetical protein
LAFPKVIDWKVKGGTKSVRDVERNRKRRQQNKKGIIRS